MSLAKLSKKLRRKKKLGRIAISGVEQTARDVVGAWRLKRDTEKDRWASEYKRGIEEANVNLMEANLSEWYRILSTEVAPRLREVVPKVYAEVVGKYRQRKKVEVPALAKA
jgi:hypothetical protein